MPVASATASAYLPQLQLQQAQRAADQAEQKARTLQSRAQEAQTIADREQETARQLQVRSDQAQQEAGNARQGVVEMKSLRQVQTGYTQIRQQISQVIKQTPSPAPSAPVVNSEGQTTGTVVNVTA